MKSQDNERKKLKIFIYQLIRYKKFSILVVKVSLFVSYLWNAGIIDVVSNTAADMFLDAQNING